MSTQLSFSLGHADSWLADLSGHEQPIGLLALVALITVIGTSVAAIRVIIVQHGQKARHLP
ncbi:hypothetical protein O7623_19935 [Solwaraspora sp. WMMD791]|uniref:hypothetical protein n=1 Tax=Solwaraspora sp. WMMD791 TaxID=3016086 RepID=UPI00249B64C7|nr:hypothetical protein [Solwaraspora sp. WMMD791]WFE25640.1 hypothetical protein O7623_19935 [Solwaraspora sp. WMMD791]